MRTAITIAVVAAGLLAVPPAAAAEPGDVARTDLRREEIRAVPDAPAAPELTDEQRAEFRRAATAAGLSDADIDRALGDPQLLATTAVHVDVEESETEVTAMPLQPGLDRYGTNAVRGRTVTRTYTARSWFGHRLFSFTVIKYWEYDGRRVVAAPGARALGHVTAPAAFGGWRYHGVIGSWDYFTRYAGRWRGGHLSSRQGKFTQCGLYKLGCVSAVYPVVNIRGHYDGTWRGWTR